MMRTSARDTSKGARMALSIGKIAAGVLVLAVSFGGAFWVMHCMSPGGRPAARAYRGAAAQAALAHVDDRHADGGVARGDPRRDRTGGAQEHHRRAIGRDLAVPARTARSAGTSTAARSPSPGGRIRSQCRRR